MGEGEGEVGEWSPVGELQFARMHLGLGFVVQPVSCTMMRGECATPA